MYDQNDQLNRELAAGGYREYYLVYNRKSTDDTDNQKNSIKYQKAENTRFASRECLSIAPLSVEGFCSDGIVSERHSGFKEDIGLVFREGNVVQYRVERPKFHRLVQWLSKGYFKGVVFLCWDRASRNKGDDTILRKLLKAGVDIRFVLAQYDKTSAGELHMDIDGMFAEHHSRVTREKVTLTFRNKRNQGIWTHQAPVGYLNTGVIDRRPFDPERAPVVRELFERAATGAWSLADLARWACAQGFTMPSKRRRRTQEEILAEEEDDVRVQIEPISRIPTFTCIHRILTNRFYTGQIQDWSGVWIPSACHEALISEDLFNQVQKQLRHKNKSAHYIECLDLPLRGLIRCGKCGRLYTPYSQKGIIYYGARCRSGCRNPKKHFNFNHIADGIGGLIAGVSFTDDELAEIDTRANTDIAQLEAKRMNQLEASERENRKIREDLAYLQENRLLLLKTGAYTPEGLVAEELKLNGQLAKLKKTEEASDVSMQETVRDVVRLSELLKRGRQAYNLATPGEKHRVVRIIFSELIVSENTLEYKCKNGFAALADRFVSLGGPKDWISEFAIQYKSIRSSIEELSEYLGAI